MGTGARGARGLSLGVLLALLEACEANEGGLFGIVFLRGEWCSVWLGRGARADCGGADSVSGRDLHEQRDMNAPVGVGGGYRAT